MGERTITTLADTVELMTSENYKDRFRAECYQLSIRLDKLNEFITKYEDESLEFKPTVSIDILREQYKAMQKYQDILMARAVLEEIRF